MLFSLEMVSNFLDKFNKVTEIRANNWRIASARLGFPQEPDDLSVLYIYDSDDRVVCRNGTDSIVVYGSNLYDVFNAVSDSMSYYNRWELRTMAAVSKSTDQRSNFGLIAELFPDFTVKVIDPEGRLLYAEGQEPMTPIDPRLIYLLRETPACHRLVLGEKGIAVIWSGQYYYKHILLASLHFSDDVYFLFSVMEDEKPLTDIEQHLAELVQNIFERAQYKSKDSSLTTYMGTFTKLLNGEAVDAAEINRFENIWEESIDEGAVLIRVELPENDKFTAHAMVSSISQKLSSAFPLIYKNSIFCLLSAEQAKKHETDIKSLAESARRPSCLSLEIHAWSEVRRAYEMTEFAAARGRGKGFVVNCRDYLWDYYLHSLQAGADMLVPHPDLIKLMDMKGEKENALLETLYCYLANNCKMAQVAEELHIHLSTLKYRMSRLLSIISFDPHDYKQRMAFLLSCDLMKQKKELTAKSSQQRTK